MATAFAAQLRNIAQNSTHELDLRARRTAHAESLLFEKEVAAKQDYETIHAICVGDGGFRDLCGLDVALVEFERNLFSPQSVTTDREHMNAAENEALDRVIEKFLTVLGSKIRLKPGVRCLEWLVRRFRAHIHNTTAVLLAVLPLHEQAIWRNVLSIVPKERCVSEWKFLGLYKAGALNVPRAAVVHAMTTNNAFFALLNRHVIDGTAKGIADAELLKFWAGIMTEAVVQRLEAARSGRKEIQKQQTEDLLLKILPLLSEGFELKGSSDMKSTCFTLAMVVAMKADLSDRVSDSLLQAVAIATGSSDSQRMQAIITSIVILGRKSHRSAPRDTVDLFAALDDLGATLTKIGNSHQLSPAIEALMEGAVHHLKARRGSVVRLAFIENLIRFCAANSSSLAVAATSIVLNRLRELHTAAKTDDNGYLSLIGLLQRLYTDRDLSLMINGAWQTLGQDHLTLGTLIGPTPTEVGPSSVVTVMAPEKKSDVPLDSGTDIPGILLEIPSRTHTTSLLVGDLDVERLYHKLSRCFCACTESESLMQKFASLPIWGSSLSENLLLATFLLRHSIDPPINRSSSMALQLLTQKLNEASGAVNTQAWLPYVLTALMDPISSVRKSAALLLLAMAEATVDGHNPTLDPDANRIYGDASINSPRAIEPSHFRQILMTAFLPELEECVLDPTRIVQLVQTVLNGANREGHIKAKSGGTELRKTLKHDLFELLTSHAALTPRLRVKTGIIRLLKNVEKVGASYKSKSLAPVLEQWENLPEPDADKAARAERLSTEEIDNLVVGIISARDKDLISDRLFPLDNGEPLLRGHLTMAFFDRIRCLWKDMTYDSQISHAQRMFELAYGGTPGGTPRVTEGAQNVLRSITLTTDILGILLEQATGEVLQQTEDNHPKKKRRTSHGGENVRPDALRMARAASGRLTLALELIDEAQLENRPELLPALFDTLSLLKQLKQHQRLDLTYLNNLCLSSILAIVEGQKILKKPTIDLSSVRADLVTDYIRTAENPQVQNVALAICTSLAAIAPDRMVHDIMPIFTFMGQSMFSKDDEHSVRVVNRAIDDVIPALVDSLRDQNKDLVRSTSSLTTSFSAAFNHIPPYRRVAMYVRLLNRMGADDFGFVIIAMLVQRKANSSNFETFLTDMLTEMTAGSLLVTFRKTIELAKDLLSSEPQLSAAIFDLAETVSMDERSQLSRALFDVALKILDCKTLQAQTHRLHKLDEDTADSLRAKIDIALQDILLTIRELKEAGHERTEEVKQCLEGLLKLPPLRELFKILSNAATSPNVDNDLKPQFLRVLAVQLEGKPSRDGKTTAAAIELLGNLAGMLAVESSASMKQAIIVCIDRLAEIYGRKDADVVVAAAAAVSSEQCLGSDNQRLQTMSLLCLASILDVLGEGCVPVVAEMLPRVLAVFRDIVHRDSKNSGVHDALFTLLAAIMTHVSFLVSDENLQDILTLSALAAVRYSSSSSFEARKEALSAIAYKVDFSTLLTVLSGESLKVARGHPEDAELESLNLLSSALDGASKANVVRNADGVSRFLLGHLDQRAILFTTTDSVNDKLDRVVSAIEAKINDIAVQYIYKINDATFRPIFESWVDWAANAYDVVDKEKREGMKPLRHVSLFGLSTHFFESLKSIVTSYAAHVIPLAQTVLQEMSSHTRSKQSGPPTVNLELYTASLGMLRSTFEHDVDGFYSVPSHFDPIGPLLISQLNLVSYKSLRETVNTAVFPAIIALATATLDTPSHHQTLSHGLVQLRHSPSAAVRLASIRAFAAITANEDVGDEFIANVIGIGSGEGEGARGTGGAGSVGEIMIYVNEMLEDDDEDVEREVRRWVQTVREKTGEDVFEV